jgi:hypothetical protein
MLNEGVAGKDVGAIAKALKAWERISATAAFKDMAWPRCAA